MVHLWTAALLLCTAYLAEQAVAVNLTYLGEELRNDVRALNASIPSSWNVSLNRTAGQCNWAGVTCSDEQGITGITLSGREVAGVLPEQWGTKFPNLTAVNLTFNSFTGSLPAGWSSLTSLVQLDLSHNKINGTLPPSWSKLAGLTYLDLSNNGLAGSLPDEWSSISTLGTLNLDHNQMTGTIPSSWSDLHLEYLRLSSNNNLCGPIPNWVDEQMHGNSSSLLDFDINATKVNSTCPIPSPSPPPPNPPSPPPVVLPDWANQLLDIKASAWPGLVYFDSWTNATMPCGQDLQDPWNGVDCDMNDMLVGLELGSADLRADVPDGMSKLTSLTLLLFGNNNIEGTLPGFLSTLTNLAVLSFEADAVLRGTLPEAWSAMTALSELRLNGNNLTGTFPPAWSSLTNLVTLDIGANHLNGTLPVALPTALTEIVFQDNAFLGTLPDAWSSLTNLAQLELHVNSLTGPLPASWSTLTGLNNIQLGNNDLTGSVPPQWSSWMSLNGPVQLINNPKMCGDWPASWTNDTRPTLLFQDSNYTAQVDTSNTGLGQTCAPVTASNTDSPAGSSSSSSGGAVAGAIIGSLIAVALAATAFWWWRRRQGRSYSYQRRTKNVDGYQDFKDDIELRSF